jgi:hypothetical protein
VAESLGNAVLKLLTEDREFSKGLSNAEKQAKEMDRQFERTSKRAKKLGAAMVAAAAAGAAALVKLTKDAVLAADKQEQAVRKLGAAIRLAGGDAINGLADFREFASNIQKITVVGDETALAMLQVATSMGLAADQAKVATKEAIGVSAAFGISATSAIRYTAALAQGDTTMLNRYIPALRTVKNDAERVALAHELLGNAFGVAKEEALAGLGPWRQLSNATGDLLEVMGKAVIKGLEPMAAGLLNLAQSEDVTIFFESLGMAIGEVARMAAELARELTAGLSETFRQWATGWLEVSRTIERMPAGLRLLIPGIEAFGKGSLVAASIFADLHETLDGASKAFDGIKTPVKDLTGALSGAGGLNDAMAGTKRVFEDTIDVVDHSEGVLQAYLDSLKQLIEQQRMFDAMEPLQLSSGLPDQIAPLPTTAVDDMEKTFEGVGKQVTVILSQSIGDALTGKGGVNYEQLGAALGTLIGNAIAPGIGGVIGGIFGAAAGGAFSGGPSKLSFKEQTAALVAGLEAMFQSINPLFAEVSALFSEISTLQRGALELGVNFETVLDAANRKLEKIRDTILGINVEDFGNRLLAALQLNAGLGLAGTLHSRTGGPGLGGSTGGGGPNPNVDPGQGGGNTGWLAFDVATEGAVQSIGKVTDSLGEMSTRFDVVGINLETFTSQLAEEFAGVTERADLAGIRATADALRAAIEEMGFSADVTAQKLREVAQAESIRISELENDVLQRLVNVMSQIPSQHQAAAELQRRIDQARFQIEVEMINLQLNALGLMSDVFQAMIDTARTFGGDLRNFHAPSLPHMQGIGGGGGIGGRPSGPSQADERQRLLDEWERFISSGRDAHSFANEIRDLRDAFFGPGGFQERFRALGLSTRQMAAEFERMRAAIVFRANEGIRNVLRDLQLGSGGFGGASLSQQFFAQGAEFRRLAGLAVNDLDQRGPLADVARAYIDSIQQMFGSSRRGQALIDEVRGTLGGILGPGGLDDPAVVLDRERNSVLYDIRELLGGEGRDREEQMLQVSRDQLGLMVTAYRQRQDQERSIRSLADELRRREKKERPWIDPAVSFLSSGRP